MREIFITIYILNHNYGHFIKNAIHSALNQCYSNYEIIILDDGSTDNSRDVLREYQNNPHLRIIYQKNAGLMPSLNRACKEARGKYVMRLDADDTLRHDALVTLSRYAKKYPNADWIFPGFYTTDKDGVIFKQENRSSSSFFIAENDDPPHGACSIIKLESLREVGGYNEKVSCRDGLDLFLKLRRRKSILSIPESLFFYRRHKSNLTENREMIREAEEDLKMQYLEASFI